MKSRTFSEISSIGMKNISCAWILPAVMGLAACSGPVGHRDDMSSGEASVAREARHLSVTRPAAHHRVVRVSDGDSLTLDSDGVIHQVRLSGIDAPELGQAHGTAAKSGLAAMVQGRQVTFTDSGQDSYHRNLVRLHVDGLDVNLQMVRQGLAWHYRNYSNDPDLAAAEREARRGRRGLWSQPDPVPPWDWRHRR